jgi:hypothetical protein
MEKCRKFSTQPDSRETVASCSDLVCLVRFERKENGKTFLIQQKADSRTRMSSYFKRRGPTTDVDAVL